jgi:hypothetical protein
MQTGWLEVIADDASPLERAQAAELRQDAKEVAEERHREQEKEAAREQRAEQMAFAEHHFGSPLAEMTAARAAYMKYDDRCRDLEARLEKERARRDRASSNIEFWAHRAEQARELVTRSAPADPVAAAMRHARETHREFARNTRAALSDAATGKQRRPFGDVSRGEHFCAECVKQGATADESFLIHADPDSALTVDPLPVPVPDDAERLSVGSYPELIR